MSSGDTVSYNAT